MSDEFAQKMSKYAELALNVGLNLQPGQRLKIRGAALGNLGTPIQTAPLVRIIAASAYKLGARFVDVIWGDDQLDLIRFQNAPRDSFQEYPTWQAKGTAEYFERGDAILAIIAENPELLKDQDPEAVASAVQTDAQQIAPLVAHVTHNTTNMCGISAAVPGWAAKVFPDASSEEQEGRLWNAIFEVCRVHRTDPVSAWKDHINELAARCHVLNQRQYHALRFTAPGTDLTVGLPRRHVWASARATSEAGIDFIRGLPTEEVNTLPHREKTVGVVRASMPLSRGGTLIEELTLIFEAGRVVNVSASKGEAVVRRLIDTDEGAGRLGEVALVPHSSPVSQTGLIFFNTLLDENAANHLALGRGYKFNLKGGAALSDDEFVARGGNDSMVHVDFMIGSGEMDVDGVREDGESEPVMRRGEWVFGV